MWFWYALMAAGISAVSVNLNKKILRNVSSSLLTWSLFALSIPLLTVLAIANGSTQINVLFFIGAMGSGTFFLLSKAIDLHSIKNNSLVKIYPLVIFSTVFNYFLGLIFFHEILRIPALIGIVLVIVGVYLLNVEKAKEGFLKPLQMLITERYALYYVFAMFLSSISTVFDKLGVTHTVPVNSPLTLLTENITSTVVLTIYFIRQKNNWFKDLKSHFFPLCIASFIYALIGILILLGFSTGPIALVSTIKRLEILFVLGVSSLFFHEKLGKHTWLAVLLLIAGVLLLKLG